MNYIIDNIDIEKYNTIEKEREQVQSDQAFQQWCKELHIGSRVEKRDSRAEDLNRQYTGYLQWINREEEARRYWPDFIVDMF